MHSVPIAECSGRAIPRGTKERLRIELVPGLMGPVSLPALVARGGADGRTLLAVAGVHGNEYEGMEALRLVFARLDPARMTGIFVALPVANPFAYEARARAAPPAVDGLNLARIFPGDPAGSPSQVLAHHLLGFVLRELGADDLFLDLHSGMAEVPFAPLVGFRATGDATAARSEAAARHFGGARLWRIPVGSGTFNGETARRGITTVGTETTGQAGCRGEDVADYVRGVMNLLTYLGITPDQPAPPRFTGPARETVDLLSPVSGFLRAARGLHDEVVAGESLGTVVDVFGEPVGEIVAPVAGTLWAARSMPAVQAGELAFMIAGRR